MDQWTIRRLHRLLSSFSFVVVYLVVGGLTKTLIVPAVVIVS